MYIGWPELRISRTAVRSGGGQLSGGPSGVERQSFARMSASISPPLARKSGARTSGASVQASMRRKLSLQQIFGQPQANVDFQPDQTLAKCRLSNHCFRNGADECQSIARCRLSKIPP